MANITESQLKQNYERYLTACRADCEQPKNFDDWKAWFVETFGATITAE